MGAYNIWLKRAESVFWKYEFWAMVLLSLGTIAGLIKSCTDDQSSSEQSTTINNTAYNAAIARHNTDTILYMLREGNTYNLYLKKSEILDRISNNSIDNAISCIEQNDLVLAETHIDYAIQAASFDSTKLAMSYYYKGIIKLKKGDSWTAIIHLKYSLLLRDNLDETWNALACALDDYSHSLIAIDCIKRAIFIDDKKAEYWFNQGNMLWHINRISDAEFSYLHALDLNPVFYVATINLSSLYSSAQKYHDAMTILEKGLLHDNCNPFLYTNWAICLLELNNPRSALQKFNSAIDCGGNFVTLWYNKALAFDFMNEIDSAIIYYGYAIKTDSFYIDALVNIAYDYDEIGDTEKAIQYLNMALRYDAKHINARINRAYMYYNSGNYDSAMADYSRILLIDSTNWPTWYGITQINIMYYQNMRAWQSTNLGRKYGMPSDRYWHCLCGIYMNERQYDSALVYVNKIISLNENDYTALANRCRILKQKGRYKEAKQSCDKAYRINQHDKKLNELRKSLESY